MRTAAALRIAEYRIPFNCMYFLFASKSQGPGVESDRVIVAEAVLRKCYGFHFLSRASESVHYSLVLNLP